MFRKTTVFLSLALAASGSRTQANELNQPGPRDSGVIPSPVVRLLESIEDGNQRELSREVIARNPSLDALQADANAARARAPQAKSLPDPVVNLTAFVGTPETRVGPQQFTIGLVQGLPWRGKRALKEEAVLLAARALDVEVEAARLRLLTESRRLGYELAFLDRRREVSLEFREHLIQHEEVARARYATGGGPGQGVVKLQAEITRVDDRLLDIERERVALSARMNALRDRPADAEIPALTLGDVNEIALEETVLTHQGKKTRPEFLSAAARIDRGRILGELADKTRRPDFKVGFVYTAVGSRDDMAGGLMPPEGNGDDIFGIQGGITLPVRRRKLTAISVEAREIQIGAEAAGRGLSAEVESAIGNLIRRLPLDWQRVRLLQDLLLLQAEESRDSARAGYISGVLNALDLLDAEHVLFDTRIAIARAQSDYLIDLARLEGEVAAPLADLDMTETNR